MSIASLDRLLFEGPQPPRLTEIMEGIAAQQLWPGFREPNDVATYLRGVAGDASDLVAASLLVLLHRDAAILDYMPWRPVAADLLSDRLDRLKPHAEQPQEKGSHAVFIACAGAVSSVEADFKSLSPSFNNLKQTSNLRNAVLRRLNGGAGSVLLRPFIPRAIIDAPFARLFDAAEAMSASELGDDDAAYAVLEEALKECEEAVALVDTHFARVTVGDVASVISEVATRRIELSRPPARLLATVDARPLPLMESGVTCDIVLHLENDSNVGASQIGVKLSADETQITIPTEPILVEVLRPRTRVPLVIPITVLRAASTLQFEVELTWQNPDHSSDASASSAVVHAQATDIDWGTIVGLQPFAPYPVEDAASLVGRAHLLKELELQFSSVPLGNMYVTGQRRVGKTSLVRVLAQQLKAINEQLLVASVDMTAVRQEGGKETISQLGLALARKLIRAANLADILEVPSFDGSMAPLTELVEEIHELDDNLTFLFVIDEFDELPDETFRRSGPGDAMFLPMRSLAQKPHVGWILVGGERMPYIRDEQATRLNTFIAKKVDYLAFVEEGPWNDAGTGNFASLILRPLPAGFEVSDEAIGHIHAVTLGNPHFAKALCTQIFEDAVRRKDALVQQRDVENAVTALAAKSDVELFAHFWEDGIFSNDGADRRRVELERRHVLAAVAECLRADRSDRPRVEAAAEKLDISRAATNRILTEFIRRGVLMNDSDQIRSKVPLFGAWLTDEGAYQLAPKGITERAEGEFKSADEAAAIGPQDISRLLKQWRSFKFRAESITREQILHWLGQFDNDVERRLMFRLLERFMVINDAELLDGLRRLNRLISHEGRIVLDKGQRTLAHVIVAGVGEPGSSGQSIAYKYRQANNLRQRNVVSVNEIAGRLNEDKAIRAVVLVDDFIGSGKTAAKTFAHLADIKRSDVQFFMFAVSGIP